VFFAAYAPVVVRARKRAASLLPIRDRYFQLGNGRTHLTFEFLEERTCNITRNGWACVVGLPLQAHPQLVLWALDTGLYAPGELVSLL